MTLAVEGGRRYLVRGTCVAAQEERHEKGALVQVEFRTEGGDIIQPQLPGWRSSEKYGLNRYVAVEPGIENPPSFTLPVAVPPDAASMVLLFTRWSSEAAPQLVGPVTAEVDSRLTLGKERPLVRQYQVQPGKVFLLSGTCVGAWNERRGAGLVAVEFLDEHDQALPGPYRHFAVSDDKSIGYYRYLEGDAPYMVWLDPPEGSRAARVRFYKWRAHGSLALSDEPRFEEAVAESTRSLERVELPHLLHVPVEGGRSYAIQGICQANEPRNLNGALLRIEMLDRDGAVIAEVPPGWQRAEGNGVTRHVPVESAESEPTPFTVPVDVPAAVRTLRLQLTRWESAHPFLLGPVAITVDPLIPLSTTDPLERRYPVTGGELHVVMGNTAGAETESSRAALVTVEYLDDDGVVLPGPYLHLSRSPREDIRYYRYLFARGGGAQTRFGFLLEPPPRAREASLRFFKWDPGVSGQLFLVDDPTLERTDSSALAERVQATPEDVELLRLLAQVQASEGELTAHVATMRRLADVLDTPQSRNVYERMAGMLQELSTTWLPHVPGHRRLERSSGPPRICHLFKVCYPFESSGGAIRNLNTVKFQRDAGLDPYVVTPLNYPATHGTEEFPDEQIVANVPHLHLRLPGGDDGLLPPHKRLVYDALLTAGVIASRGADLIHAASGFRGYELALKGLALREHFGVPLIYEARSLHEHLWGRGHGEKVLEQEWTRLRMAQENRCMQEADAVVTIAEAMREVICARGIPDEKIHVVPNGVDAEKFEPLQANLHLKRELGFGESTVVGYISNVSYREGHDILLRAMARLMGQRDDLCCLLVGEGPERPRLEELAAALGIHDRVVFTGEVDHDSINDYYSIIDVFVVPRRADYASDYVTPLKPFEALALERALIVSDRPSLREIVGDDLRGLTFRTEDDQHLAERIAELADQPERRLALGSEGRDWILRERTWVSNARRYEEIYAGVLEATAAQRTERKRRVAGRAR